MILLLLSVIVLLAIVLTKPFYWLKREVKTYRIPIPLLGSIPYVFGKSLAGWFEDIYNHAGAEPYIGLHIATLPTLFIKNTELIKDILVTDFDVFSSHGFSKKLSKTDKMADNLFAYQGERWKVVRNKISPIFTSAKMKTQFSRLVVNVNKLVSVIDGEGGAVDALNVMLKHSTHSSVQFLFGVDTDIYDDDSEFQKLEDKLFDPAFTRSMIFTTFLPDLAVFIGFQFGQMEVRDFVHKFANRSITLRKESGERRNDFVQVLLDNEGTSGGDEYFQDGTIVPNFDESMQIGNTLLMYSAGVETTGISLAFCLYEIAANPQVQMKIREELQSKLQSKEIEYDDLSTLTYLNMTISEGLRKYPLVSVLVRKATKDYTVRQTGLKIPEGTVVLIPAFSIHMDPKIWPEPQTFKPERFLNSPVLGTYLPFGQGPRICIGMKLAQVNMTYTIASLVRKYEIVLDSKCQSPPVISPYRFINRPDHPLWLNFRPLKVHESSS